MIRIFMITNKIIFFIQMLTTQEIFTLETIKNIQEERMNCDHRIYCHVFFQTLYSNFVKDIS